MKTIVAILLLIPAFSFSQSVSIVGRWQLVNQSSCVEDEIGAEDDDMQDLVEDMKSRSSRTPQVIEFRDNNSGKESTKIISKKKSYNSNSFLYRFDGRGLYFLDKKSRMIIEGFTVEKLEIRLAHYFQQYTGLRNKNICTVEIVGNFEPLKKGRGLSGQCSVSFVGRDQRGRLSSFSTFALWWRHLRNVILESSNWMS